MKYINRDHACKRWIKQEDIPARELARSGFSVTVGAMLALILIVWLES